MDLNDNMDLAEDFISVCNKIHDGQMSGRFEIPGNMDEEKSKPVTESEMALFDKLNFVLENNFKTSFIHRSLH
jgi:asparaginyl-tRNA synthetase